MDNKTENNSNAELAYTYQAKNLNGITKLDFLKTNGEKVSELFRQMEGLISLIGENNISDMDYIKSLEREMKRLCEWIKTHKGIFIGNQYPAVKKKAEVFKQLLDAKYEWLDRKEKRDLVFEINRLNGLVVFLNNKLRENGIHVGLNHPSEFDEEKWKDILWRTIDTSKKPESAKHKLTSMLNDYFAEWYNDPTIEKFYKRALLTIDAKVSEQRFDEKSRNYPSNGITEDKIRRMADELNEMEDFQKYTDKLEQYTWLADEAGYLKLFKKLLK